MAPPVPVWKWIVSLVVVAIGAVVAIPLYRYADRDDAPGGMVIAFLMFLAATAIAIWVVSDRRQVHKPNAGRQ